MNEAKLVLDVTIDKDSTLILEDKDGTGEVRLELKAREHITVYVGEKQVAWVESLDNYKG